MLLSGPLIWWFEPSLWRAAYCGLLMREWLTPILLLVVSLITGRLLFSIFKWIKSLCRNPAKLIGPLILVLLAMWAHSSFHLEAHGLKRSFSMAQVSLLQSYKRWRDTWPQFESHSESVVASSYWWDPQRD
jgi:hypothetical protein